MKVKEALQIVGGLSNPGKMPCPGWSIPAIHCITGSKLRLIDGTTCKDCYALKGLYRFKNVINALDRRFQILIEVLNDKSKQDLFEKAFQKLLEKQDYFRWHDAGDLQSEKHLDLICRIANQNPGTKFWIPTREFSIVKNYLKRNKKPKNLTIRLSAHKVDSAGPEKLADKFGLSVSGVSTNPLKSKYRLCDSKFVTNGKYTKSGKLETGFCSGTDTRTGEKVDCRLCWNSPEPVNYPIH